MYGLVCVSQRGSKRLGVWTTLISDAYFLLPKGLANALEAAALSQYDWKIVVVLTKMLSEQSFEQLAPVFSVVNLVNLLRFWYSKVVDIWEGL